MLIFSVSFQFYRMIPEGNPVRWDGNPSSQSKKEELSPPRLYVFFTEREFFFSDKTMIAQRHPIPRRILTRLEQRPYLTECIGSLSISEVKWWRARLVLAWVTSREAIRVLSAFSLLQGLAGGTG